MGIRDLNTILNNLPENPIQKILITEFSGTRIAIDANLWVFANFSNCQKEVIMKMTDPLQVVDRNIILDICKKNMINFITNMCKNGITTVWVWDGESHPEKEIAKSRRSKAKTSNINKIADLKTKLENIHPLARLPSDIQLLKEAMCGSTSVSKQEMNILRLYTENLGIPTLVSKYEAEKLCAALSIEKIVSAVWSTDTDNYVLGTRITILGFDGYYEGVQCFKIGILSKILEGLKMTHNEFIDLCIMLETDFNNRIYGVGPVKCLDYINDYRSIDAARLVKPTLSWTDLNHIRCREIFRYEPSNIDSNTLLYDISKIPPEMGPLKNSVQAVPKPKNMEY